MLVSRKQIGRLLSPEARQRPYRMYKTLSSYTVLYANLQLFAKMQTFFIFFLVKNIKYKKKRRTIIDMVSSL